MLKDAALLQLELLAEALEEGMILIDASSFNVQWRGANPVFIDVPSLRRVKPGEPWVGYRQFCQMHLFPLLLRAYKDLDFLPLLRGSVDGITPSCNAMMSLRDRFRRGVFSHVYLHSKLEQRYGQTERKVGEELKSSGFNDELIKANVAGLRKLVGGLAWKASQSEWSDYTRTRSYSGEGLQAKKAFVERALAGRRWERVWDLGCNTGEFSEMAAAHADSVVAMDADQLAIDLLYRRLREGGPTNVLPLVSNLADPSPAIGWRNRERKTLPERGRPDLVMSLALIHHVVLGANNPVEEYVDWLAALTRHGLIVEFVNRNDPMVGVLLRNKEDKVRRLPPRALRALPGAALRGGLARGDRRRQALSLLRDPALKAPRRPARPQEKKGPEPYGSGPFAMAPADGPYSSEVSAVGSSSRSSGTSTSGRRGGGGLANGAGPAPRLCSRVLTPVGKATSILSKPRAAATTPRPKLGCSRRSLTANASLGE